MKSETKSRVMIRPEELVLVTGAGGFLGSRVVACLRERGFRNIRCFVRAAGEGVRRKLASDHGSDTRIELFQGNLLSQEDCAAAAENVSVIFHLAAGRGEKSFADAVMNSVVTTRNLLNACRGQHRLRRFVNISSFSVYTNPRQALVLDETCPVEAHPELREAYCFAKVKQDGIVTEYAKEFGIPYVIVRPGVVYGPGNLAIHSRVGIDTFGVFMHMGGSNPVPFTYVDNCAEAIVLAGIIEGIDGEAFNVVDDDLPTSRQFLSLYKRNVRQFSSLYVPRTVSYGLCYLWERYAEWSEGQLPPTFNRRRWRTFWKKTYYSNEKLKRLVGWHPRIPPEEGFRRYFVACREGEGSA
jgi:nucleoside-diphosphate-sugar epimerase